MTKYLFLPLLLILYSLPSKAQFLTQSADGQGTIPLPLNGIGIGFDIGKTELTFGLNNYKKVLSSPDNKFKHNYLLGLNLAVKNSDGLGSLFSSGDIVPDGNFLGIAGYSISNSKHILSEWKVSDLIETVKSEEGDMTANFILLQTVLLKVLDSCLVDILDKKLIASTKKTITEAIIKADDVRALNLIANGINQPNNPALNTFEKHFQKKFAIAKEKINKDGIDRSELTKAIDFQFDKFLRTHVPIRVTPFLIGGINARSFSLFTGTDRSNLSNSFEDTLYRGGNIGIGANLRVANFWFGITYSYLNGDNFSNLTSKNYSLHTYDTVGNQVLTSEKKITAYSGKYSKVESNQFNMDLVGEFTLSDTSRLIANAYYHSSIHSRDTAYLKNYKNIGLGLYFTGKKSKFLGGLYVELPDISNEIEKAKPIAMRNIRSPLKKLTFGITTKFSISSILNFQNRPRTPDL